MTNLESKKTSGFIVLATVLVVFVVLTALVISAPLLSINDGLQSLTDTQSQQARDLTEACVEEMLWQLNQTNAVPALITLPEVTCSLVVNSQIGDIWSVTVSANNSAFGHTIQVTANRSGLVKVDQWAEE